MKSIVKNLVNKINLLKEQYNAIIAIKIGLFKCEFRYTFEKDNISLNVFYAPLVLKANGNIGARVTKYNGINYVYTDEHFENLQKDEQEAILLHELHHILNGDRVSTVSILKRAAGFKSSIKIEIMADEYAVKNSSKQVFINALMKILECTPKSKEIKMRIRHIKNMEAI